MTVATGAVEQPQLVYFHSMLSGNCRRVEGFIAQVLQKSFGHERHVDRENEQMG